MDIEEMLDREGTVFIDTSVIHLHKKQGNIEGGRYIYVLDDDRLDDNIRIAEDAICLLESKKVKVIPEVLAEIGHIENLLDRTIDLRARNRKLKRITEVSTKDYQLSLLKDHIDSIVQLAEQSKVRNHDPLLSKLAELTDFITHHWWSKKQKRSEDYFKPYKDTDTKIVAHSIYAAVYEGNSSAILTGDSDFATILPASFKIMTSEYMKPQGELFYKRLVENPITLYFKNGESYKKAMSTDEITLVRMYRLKNLPSHTNLQILKDVKSLLSDIQTSRSQQSLPQEG
jgi:ArsR family metal-binding transcriptional regulator